MFRNRLCRLHILAAAIGMAILVGLIPSAADAAPFPLPDLQIAYTGAPSALAGQTFTWSVKMFNTGAPTPANQRISFIGSLPVGFKISKMLGSAGVTCDFVNDAEIALEGHHPLWACILDRPMPSNNSVVASATVKAPAALGAYIFDATADYCNAIAESNEMNNDTRATFTVR